LAAGWRCVLALLPALVIGSSCSPLVRSDELSSASELDVVLDATARAVVPGKKIKFFVEITNRTGSHLDLGDVAIELTASPKGDPATVALRKTWTYRLNRPLVLAPGKRATLPIVPETITGRSAVLGQEVSIGEFPLAQLAEGDYEIRATVNGLRTSPPYPLRVSRPDLEALLRQASRRPG
jgi:hypothetical protein